MLQKPRIVAFSGSGDTKEVSFEAWRYEVSTLLKEKIHSRSEIETAAKKSLRGAASDVVRRMGVEANLEAILSKLTCVYGVVEQTDSLLTQFYSAEQQPKENVSNWACRLDDLLDRANQQERIHGRSMDEMLHNRFWHGLKSHLKEAARHKMERITDFDHLLVEVRRIECEFGEVLTDVTDKKAQINAMTSGSKDQRPNKDEDSLTAVLAKINCRLDDVEQSLKTIHNFGGQQEVPEVDNGQQTNKHGVGDQGRGRGRNRGRGHDRGHSQDHGRSSRSFHQSGEGAVNNTWRNNDHNNYSNRYNAPDNSGSYPTHENQGFNRGFHQGFPPPSNCHRKEIICYRCGQPVHVVSGCRVDLDSLNQ